MGKAMQCCPCKSLIPILRRPSLAYVLDALKSIDCTKCILCIDRDELRDEITRIGIESGVPFTIFRDSAGGPTSVALEAAVHVRSSHFLMLHGHQIVYPDFLAEMRSSSHDFVATVYPDSSEGVRKIATLDDAGFCASAKRGSADEPARAGELYLDKPYLLKTEPIAHSVLSDERGDPAAPIDDDLRPHTVLRYMRKIYTIPATFRHEYHYMSELPDVMHTAETFSERYAVRP